MSRFCIFDLSLLEHKALMFLLVTFQTTWLQTLCWALHGFIFIICLWGNAHSSISLFCVYLFFSVYLKFHVLKIQGRRSHCSCKSVEFNFSVFLLRNTVGPYYYCDVVISLLAYVIWQQLHFLINTVCELPSCLP